MLGSGKKLKGYRSEYTYFYGINEEERDGTSQGDLGGQNGNLGFIPTSIWRHGMSTLLHISPNTCNVQADFFYPQQSGTELKERESRVRRELT